MRRNTDIIAERKHRYKKKPDICPARQMLKKTGDRTKHILIAVCMAVAAAVLILMSQIVSFKGTAAEGRVMTVTFKHYANGGDGMVESTEETAGVISPRAGTVIAQYNKDTLKEDVKLKKYDDKTDIAVVAVKGLYHTSYDSTPSHEFTVKENEPAFLYPEAMDGEWLCIEVRMERYGG